MAEFVEHNLPEIKDPKYFFYVENIHKTLNRTGLLSFFTVAERPTITSIPIELRGKNFVQGEFHYEIVNLLKDIPIVHVPKDDSNITDIVKSSPLGNHYTYGVMITDETHVLFVKLTDDSSVPIFNMSDRFHITSGMIANYDGPLMLTDVGKFFINYLFFASTCGNKVPYINKLINTATVDEAITAKIVDGIITRKEFNNIINHAYWFGEDGTITIQTLTERALGTDPKIAKRKAELLEQYKDKLHDTIVLAKIEKELIDMDKAYIKGDESEPFFQAVGSKSFNEQRKKMYIMFGMMPDFNKKNIGVNVILNNMEQGYTKQDIPAVANEIRRGAYGRGSETALGGAESKLITRAFQDIKITQADCGSKRGYKLLLTEHNAKAFVYRYLTDGTLLTKDNIKSYIGKTVSLRSPMYCATPDGLCARCCGKLAEDQNIVNVGMHSLAIAETMVYVAMKAMHVSSVSLYTVEDINRFIIE
jgi:hypothetical protein